MRASIPGVAMKVPTLQGCVGSICIFIIGVAAAMVATSTDMAGAAADR